MPAVARKYRGLGDLAFFVSPERDPPHSAPGDLPSVAVADQRMGSPWRTGSGAMRVALADNSG
jgi:hypothetical protein